MFFDKRSRFIETDVFNAYLKILCQAGCMNFLEKIVEEDTAEFLRLPIISDTAAESLKKILRGRLEKLYRQPLIKTLRFAVKEFDAAEFVSPTGKSYEALNTAAKKIFNELVQDTVENFKKKYFILSDYEKFVRKNFRDFISEFLERFSLRQSEISAQFFSNKKITKLLSIGADGADTHRHGRTVIRVTTDAGTCYYKPHDCQIDVLYEKIVTKYFSDCTVAAKIISGEGYGFVKELVPTDVEKLSDVEKYFYNFGILTAMFHGFGSSDMHGGNIMACGVYPCVIDLETLFNYKKKSALNLEHFSVAASDLAFSVNRTGVMPNRVHLLGISSPLYSFDNKTFSLPHFQGKSYSVEGYEENFLQGFNDGYERLLKHRQEIISLIKNYEGAIIRVVLRNTVYYASMQTILFHEENLSSEENRQEILEKLKTHYEKANGELVPSIINHEKISLLECEIPYFCTRLDSRTLCGNDINEILKENFFAESAEEFATFRLNHLSVAEKNFELEYIKRHFKHLLLDEKVTDKKICYSEKNFSVEDAENLAGKIFEELLDDVIYTTDETSIWHTPILNSRTKPLLSILTPQINAAQYCGKILKQKSLVQFHERAMTLKNKCLKAVAAQILLWKNSNADFLSKLPLGIYNGLGGIISACIELGEEKILQLTLKLIEDKKIYGGENINVADGAAGLLLALNKLKTESYNLQTIIRNCAENILKKGFDKEVDAPYGIAGLGTALAVAYKFTNDKKYLDAAVNAFEKICESYIEHLNGWADDDSIVWLANRAPKSAGIGICAMYAAEISSEKIFDEVLKLALHSVETEDTLTWNDSLNQGNALYVKFLIMAAKKFNVKNYLERAGKILTTMNERAKTEGNFRLTEKGVKTSFEVAMFTGSLGIGYSALEFVESL